MTGGALPTVVGPAAHVNRIHISIGFPVIECVTAVRAAMTDSRYCRGAPPPAASALSPQGVGRDSGDPATRRVARAWLRAAREVGSDAGRSQLGRRSILVRLRPRPPPAADQNPQLTSTGRR